MFSLATLSEGLSFRPLFWKLSFWLGVLKHVSASVTMRRGCRWCCPDFVRFVSG